MSLSTDGAWKAGVWAETVWADEIWREGEAPEEPEERAAEEVPEQPVGGWLFLNLYEAELQRRRERERRQREIEAETESIESELDRNIALLLREQEAADARRAELERLGELARSQADIDAAKAYSERVARAYERAAEKGTYSALEALDRELTRAREEEEFLIIAMMMLEH